MRENPSFLDKVQSEKLLGVAFKPVNNKDLLTVLSPSKHDGYFYHICLQFTKL